MAPRAAGAAPIRSGERTTGAQRVLQTASRLEALLEAGWFVVTAELGPPKSANVGFVERKAGFLRDHVDAINVTDNQTAIVRLSSIATGAILVRMGLEPIIQLVVRDRNRIAMQSDILGAAALGIRNILCLSGDHQSFGNHPGSKGVYDLDSMQLLQLVRRMRDGSFLSGDTIKTPPKLYVGAAANPFADPLAYRVPRLDKKVRAGAEFIQTQAVYDLDRFRGWLDEACARGLDTRVHILAGVVPLKSVRAARYMNAHVAGISIPESLIDRLDGAADPKAEGLAIAVETIAALRELPGVHGVHIMAIAWEAKVAKIVERAGLSPRPASPTADAGAVPVDDGYRRGPAHE